MPLFRVRDGEVLGHDGKTRVAGEVIELARSVAEDPAVRGAVEEVDAAGNPVAAPPPDDLARFRTHERVSMLRQQLADAQAVVEQLQARLKAEEQRLTDEVAAIAAKAVAAPASDAAASAPASGKQSATKGSKDTAAPANPAS